MSKCEGGGGVFFWRSPSAHGRRPVLGGVSEKFVGSGGPEGFSRYRDTSHLTRSLSILRTLTPTFWFVGWELRIEWGWGSFSKSSSFRSHVCRLIRECPSTIKVLKLYYIAKSFDGDFHYRDGEFNYRDISQVNLRKRSIRTPFPFPFSPESDLHFFSCFCDVLIYFRTEVTPLDRNGQHHRPSSFYRVSSCLWKKFPIRNPNVVLANLTNNIKCNIPGRVERFWF